MRAPMKAIVLLISAIFVLGTFGLASGQNVFVDMGEVEGLVDGMIPEGVPTDLVIPVRFTNAVEDRGCISNGYAFTSENVNFGAVDGAWNPAYPWNMELGFPLMLYPWFDQGTFINYFDSDGDSNNNGIGFAGLSNAMDGLPTDFDDIAYNITVAGVTGTAGQVLTMDSSFWMPANVWLWCGEPTLYPPWGGPYEFVVAGPDETAPSFTSSPVLDGVVGDPYTYDVDADGTPAPEFELTVAPAGMDINVITGVIIWAPDADGVFPVQVRAFNGVAPDAFQDFDVTVTPAPEPPTFSSTPSTDGQVGTVYTYTIVVDGYPVPTLALTAAPAGMTLVGNEISWTPTAAGDFPVTVEATNSSGTVPQDWTIAVVPALLAPTITSTPVEVATIGVLYTYNVDADGYLSPTYTLDVYPTGMVIDPVSGVIEWTPDAAGAFDVTVVATNASGTDDQVYVINISDDPYTDCWPQPWDMGEMINDRVLEVYIYNENVADVDLASVRVGNIPPYNPIEVVDGVINTDCFIMRFLGSSGFRPLPPEGIHDTYTVSYNYLSGGSNSLVGDFNLSVKVGDVNLDGIVDVNDVQFMSEYFWNGGEETKIQGETLYELMDVDGNGQVDIRDALKTIELAGL